MARNGLDRVAAEIAGQPEALREFARSRVPKASRGSIFVGAGDSYAAALAGFYASGGRCIALDPYTLASEPGIAKGLEVFFISASGKTSSNLTAARKVAGVARRTTAVTAKGRNSLAALVDRVVRIPMTYIPKTSGMLSFSLALAAVLRIARGETSCDFDRAMTAARTDSVDVSFGSGTTYFLGNSLAYPVALYAAAKSYEVLGTKAHAELLEEFSHMQLFSLAKEDAVNVFSCFDPLGLSERLRSALSGRGYDSHRIPERGPSSEERLFHAVFVAQLSVVTRAKIAGLSEPTFLSTGYRLGLSDSMIY
jgi:fructoselysine-6-P-deglycase FrlB-like protein